MNVWMSEIGFDCSNGFVSMKGNRRRRREEGEPFCDSMEMEKGSITLLWVLGYLNTRGQRMRNKKFKIKLLKLRSLSK